MAMNKSDADRMKTLLMEAVTTLCRSGIRFDDALRVEGLIAVTVDENDIIVVNVNKTYENPNAAARKAAENSAAEKAVKEASSQSAVSEQESDGAEVSDGGTRHKRRRKKRKRQSENCEHPEASSGNMMSSDGTIDYNETPSNMSQRLEASSGAVNHCDSLSKRLRDDKHTDTDSESGCGAEDNSHNNRSSSKVEQGSAYTKIFKSQSSSSQNEDLKQHGEDAGHAIKIEIDSDSDTNEKEQLATELFSANQENDQSLYAVPIDQSQVSQSGLTEPVCMFTSVGMIPSGEAGMSSAAAFPGVSDPQMSFSDASFTSPQQRIPEHAERKKYPCPVCHKAFTQTGSRARHIKTHHFEGPPRFSCHSCSYETNRGDLMKLHLMKSHPESLKNTRSKPSHNMYISDMD